MKSCSRLCCAITAWLLVWAPIVNGGSIAIQLTPILNATLPGGTYQVESSTDGTVWQPTGVLVAGNGAPSAVRLDGFSSSLKYRYSRVGPAATVTPTVTSGLGLSNSFTGATELRIESTTGLPASAWTTRKFVFPDLNGAFLNAVRSPTQACEFFRAVQPATPMVLDTVASYTADPNSGAAGFGIVADDMPQLYRDGFICAPCPTFYHRGGTNAAAAGECYEFTGPIGTTTVMVGDMDDVPPVGTCDPGHSYFDIGTPAFTNLFAEAGGFGTITYRLVPAPVIGNLKLVVPVSAGGFYFELRPYNHRAGVSKLEILGSGSGTWIELLRSTYNSFVYSGSEITFPISVRVTSRFGEVVNFPPIASMTANQRFTASNQFTVFPELSPAPVWILPPIYQDALSSIPGGQWTTTPFSGATVNPVNAIAAYQGTAGLSISNFAAFSGVIFLGQHRFPKPVDGTLEFAIRSATTTAATNLTITVGGYDNTGAATTSSAVQLPAISNTWRVIRIPLEPVAAPFRIGDFRIVNNGASVAPPVFLDSILFRQP